MTARRGRPRDTAARARVVATAGELFARQGFLATTVGEVAAGAEVSVQTVYSGFGSKVGVLSAVHDVALAGDDEPVPLVERDWFRALDEAPDAEAALDAALEQMCASTARVAPVYAAMLAAEADPDVAALLSRLRDERLAFARLLTDRLLTRPGARGADRDRVADLLYAAESVEGHQLLVAQRGWSLDAWRAWVHGVVAQALTAS